MTKQVDDFFGAFVPGQTFEIQKNRTGPLSDMTFAAKDLFDVEGRITGAGNPQWARTHPVANANAETIETLLSAGAKLFGKTITDELAYSINGDNHHYGTPVNPRAKDRFPGGSSSGSAVAVASGLVDFSLGSDSGGSIRVPSSFCGIYGMRTTHGLISTKGMVPLMPSFDTVGWFSRDMETFEKVATVLLPCTARPQWKDVVILEDALTECDAQTKRDFLEVSERIKASFNSVWSVRISQTGLEQFRKEFREVAAWEAWKTHGEWIKANSPKFGPAIAERFSYAAQVKETTFLEAWDKLVSFRRDLENVVKPGTIIIAPTAPGPAPLLESSATLIETYRQKAQRLTCIAGIGGLPELSMPVLGSNSEPVGLSLIGSRGQDLSIVHFGQQILTDLIN